MSPHRRDFKRRRKSKFKNRSKPTSTTKLPQLRSIPHSNNSIIIGKHDIGDIKTTPSPGLDQNKMHRQKVLVTFPSTMSATHPLKMTSHGMSNEEKSMLHIIEEEDDEIVSFSKGNSINTGSTDKYLEQTAIVYFDGSSVSAAGVRLLFQPNEYYAKYSRNKSHSKTIDYYCRQILQRTTTTAIRCVGGATQDDYFHKIEPEEQVSMLLMRNKKGYWFKCRWNTSSSPCFKVSPNCTKCSFCCNISGNEQCCSCNSLPILGIPRNYCKEYGEVQARWASHLNCKADIANHVSETSASPLNSKLSKSPLSKSPLSKSPLLSTLSSGLPSSTTSLQVQPDISSEKLSLFLNAKEQEICLHSITELTQRPYNDLCFLSNNHGQTFSFPILQLLVFLVMSVTCFYNKIISATLTLLCSYFSPAAYLLLAQRHRHLSAMGQKRLTDVITRSYIKKDKQNTERRNVFVDHCGSGRVCNDTRERAGQRFRSCQIMKGKSDFICIIALGLCLLSSNVTPVTISNDIYPMDSASHVERELDGELSIPVEGCVGKRVEMPCDIRPSPSRRDDTVYMVLWFRSEESIPIYSLDVRGKHVGGGKPWSAEKPFGKRAYFQSTSEPARLIIEGAKTSDQGIYRCRVDFRNSPSRETRLNLTITVPPNEPQIYDSTGMSIRGEVGPYLEGSNIELTCIVREGDPSPMVQWYLNDELIDSSYHVKNEKEVINHISVPNIQRSHHRASLSCRASNTLLVPPVTKTVYFELNLRPLTVSIPIKHRNPQLTTETQYEIKCESWGSHPPPVMTWWLDGREEKGSAIEESRGTNNSVSRLFFTPNASVDGQVLTCRAENSHVTAGAMEDSWRLRVVYPPMLTLRMGSSLNPRDIKEGDDVYFECHIRANPQVHKLAWYHNGLLLHHNRSAGVILSNQSLVLQKVSRPSAGNYSCKANNAQGEGVSPNVLLDIMYAPACQTELSGTDAPIIIAASRSEDVNITCEMDALPDRLKFQWTHTNTVGENSELEPDMYTSLGSKSLLRYHLRSEEDFGTLLCWAHNSIGAAERPCVYQLVPADVPQPVENCSIINRTSTSVEITCEPGFDGGLPQSFLLEAYQTNPTEHRGLLYNITLEKPTFSLSRLDADGTFHFKIYSVNRKGRSGASIMDGIVLRYPAMQSAKVRDLEKTTIAIIIGAASAVLLGVISLIAFIVHRIRHPISSVEMEKSYSREFGNNRRGSGDDELYRNESKKGGNPPFTATSEFDEDGDPDLIPTSKNVKAAAMGSVYSRLSNGEINQRYVAEKIPLRPMDPDLPVSMSCAPVNSTSVTDPYAQGLPNYATLRGTHNGLGLKQNAQQRQQQQPRPMVSSSSSSFHHGKSSTIVVNIDTRLIGQQLASNQLPESCV